MSDGCRSDAQQQTDIIVECFKCRCSLEGVLLRPCCVHGDTGRFVGAVAADARVTHAAVKGCQRRRQVILCLSFCDDECHWLPVAVSILRNDGGEGELQQVTS